jgi:response regulator NasT
MATSLRILLADDESLNILALRAQLEALGHCIVGSARDGIKAVELARTTTFDLAILDIRMPRLSGVRAAAEIVREQPVPIIFLTGHSDTEWIEEVTAAPVFHYLIKPVSLEDLSPAITIVRSRFKEWSQSSGEVAVAHQSVEDGAVIERAKALVMEARGLSEDGAYQLLERESESRNEPLGKIARTVLLAGKILRDPFHS